MDESCLSLFALNDRSDLFLRSDASFSVITSSTDTRFYAFPRGHCAVYMPYYQTELMSRRGVDEGLDRSGRFPPLRVLPRNLRYICFMHRLTHLTVIPYVLPRRQSD
jgi:hypothetical protein